MANTYDMTGVPTGDEWLLNGTGFRGAKAASIYNQRQEDLRNAVISAQEAYEKGIAAPGITEEEKARLAGVRDDAIYNATVRRYANNTEAITRLQEQRAIRGVMTDLNGLYNGVTSNDPQTRLASAQRLLKDYGNQFLRGGRYEVSLGKNGELLYQAFDSKGNATMQPQPVTPRVLQESFTNAMNFGILRVRGNIEGLKDSEAIKTSIGNRVSQAAGDDRADFVSKDNAQRANFIARTNADLQRFIAEDSAARGWYTTAQGDRAFKYDTKFMGGPPKSGSTNTGVPKDKGWERGDDPVTGEKIEYFKDPQNGYVLKRLPTGEILPYYLPKGMAEWEATHKKDNPNASFATVQDENGQYVRAIDLGNGVYQMMDGRKVRFSNEDPRALPPQGQNPYLMIRPNANVPNYGMPGDMMTAADYLKSKFGFRKDGTPVGAPEVFAIDPKTGQVTYARVDSNGVPVYYQPGPNTAPAPASAPQNAPQPAPASGGQQPAPANVGTVPDGAGDQKAPEAPKPNSVPQEQPKPKAGKSAEAKKEEPKQEQPAQSNAPTEETSPLLAARKKNFEDNQKAIASPSAETQSMMTQAISDGVKVALESLFGKDGKAIAAQGESDDVYGVRGNSNSNDLGESPSVDAAAIAKTVYDAVRGTPAEGLKVAREGAEKAKTAASTKTEKSPAMKAGEDFRKGIAIPPQESSPAKAYQVGAELKSVIDQATKNGESPVAAVGKWLSNKGAVKVAPQSTTKSSAMKAGEDFRKGVAVSSQKVAPAKAYEIGRELKAVIDQATKNGESPIAAVGSWLSKKGSVEIAPTATKETPAAKAGRALREETAKGRKVGLANAYGAGKWAREMLSPDKSRSERAAAISKQATSIIEKAKSKGGDAADAISSWVAKEMKMRLPSQKVAKKIRLLIQGAERKGDKEYRELGMWIESQMKDKE